ncbi:MULTISPECIES: preprotein translocase subunit SecE [Gardnerella]|uniref:Protein translocase subunit SecE n=1 Tax=Gardnerella greenwoodii TaxID=2914925 RepID=A0A2N6RWT5_9BIFI|nr:MULTISPECIES: preprotein translocase subunit SecE [Gardnerella]EIK88095.1 preprotein translocase subunit SecE [Gardnerella vaginalis 6119V5]MDF0753891.1 preprotein translocase subunit SecE [Gardnerella greenwoodii]PMC42575.1 preprotein translocase subunit SecE [Gardnerella greenwoodii]RIY18139.1 preprotein translocase subunit SecE [Bifidobacteriaceae bacterium WP012]
MAQARSTNKAVKPNLFMRIGMFVKQTIDETRKVVAPHGKELFAWSIAVFIFVVFLMAFVTCMDLGLGKFVMWLFG